MLGLRKTLAGVSALAMVTALGLAGCGGDGNEIRDQRVVTSDGVAPSPSGTMSTGERFGFRQRAQAASQPAPPAYSWTAPDSWESLPSEPLRPANFRAGDDGAVEVYLSVLRGDGGGVTANVNRWRGQIGLAELDEEAIGALPTAEILGQEAVLVDFEGAYTGMEDEVVIEDARMLGAVLIDGGQGVFAKMVGPTEAVDAERDNFDVFLNSLEPNAAAAHAHAGHGHGGDDGWTHPPIGDGDGWQHPPIDGDGGWEHPPIPEGMDGMSETAFQSERPDGLQWDAPEGWRQAPDRPVRVVTFKSGANQEVETYVTILSGTAGGLEMNVNRWRQEMGQSALNPAAVAALPEVDVLGETGKLVEVEGNYAGKTGDRMESAKMLGVIAPLDGQVVFVRMTGPQAAVREEREDFIAFCESLRLGGA